MLKFKCITILHKAKGELLMKNLLKLRNALFLLMLLILNPKIVHASEINNNFKDIPLNKSWKIIFNDQYDINTINNNTIIIEDLSQNIIPLKYEFDVESHSITVTPTSNYKPDTLYNLIVNNHIFNLDGQALYKKVELQFKTTKDINSIDYILPLIKSSEVIANINMDSNIYEYISNYDYVTASLKSGDTVEIIEDRQYKWYKVKTNSGVYGWIESDFLNIPENPNTTLEELTSKQLETYVNYKNFSSSTNQLIWVDLDRQLTYIFTGTKNNWTHIKTIAISSGKNISPTIRGSFTIKERGDWFYSNFFQSGAKNWLQFNGDYLFHSLPLDINGNIQDSTLRERRSAGCLRMSLENSEWFYSNILRGSTVFVN